MSEVESKIKKILEYSNYFYKLNTNKSFLYNELNDISEKTIILIKNSYKDSNKINKIRYQVVEKLEIGEKITKEILEEIKENVNNGMTPR
ncbi:hypothetical protein CRU96_07375 [Malaciobacter halophilus]|nr:hypothetical protein [Malaciobacter halophilus]RYA23592.1 hypothetical protein CRU96_07375 [Malaciobacter halophilus]